MSESIGRIVDGFDMEIHCGCWILLLALAFAALVGFMLTLDWLDTVLT